MKLFQNEKVIRLRLILLWGLALLSASYFFYFTTINASRSTHGFATYYTASKLFVEGESVSQFYNDEWFSKRVERFVPKVYEIYNVNLPTASLLVLPLVGFDHTDARIIWIVLNIILLLLSIFILNQKLEFKNYWLPLILILFFSFQPIYANVLFGQAYIFIFFLLVLVWYGYLENNYMLIGITIGTMFILKSTSIILFLLFIFQKKWKSILWGFAVVLIVILISLPWIGLDAWTTYANKVVEYSSSPSLSVTAYQTIHSFFYHFTVFDPGWNPEPILNYPSIGILLNILCSLFILISSLVLSIKNKNSELILGLFVTVAIILSPVSIDYHYILLLLPILILIKYLRRIGSTKIWLLLLTMIILIAAPLPYTSTRIATGILALFAYPKFYGAVGLLIIFFWLELKLNSLKRKNIPI